MLNKIEICEYLSNFDIFKDYIDSILHIQRPK